MKNYLGWLGLQRKASAAELSDAFENAQDNTGDAQSLADANTILGDVTMRVHYERTHLQYEAINAALHCLEFPEATDSYRWSERLVEFDIESAEPVD